MTLVSIARGKCSSGHFQKQ
uniref:Uncharacterized protein n=1 Tax=Arundo donax TaxID=35708 RepID=A0A0A8YM07_ARUDO